MAIPKHNELYNLVLESIKMLGGGASITDINNSVKQRLSLSDEELTQRHAPDDARTELEYRLAWTRTYLKWYGLLERNRFKQWVLTPKGQDIESVDPAKVDQAADQMRRRNRKDTTNVENDLEHPKQARLDELDAQISEEEKIDIQAQAPSESTSLGNWEDPAPGGWEDPAGERWPEEELESEEETETRSKYQILPEVVAKSLAQLRDLKIHRTFAGYLCLKRTAARDNTTSRLQPNFKEFFDTFLRVPDSSDQNPYVVAFLENPPSQDNKWSNVNVAGSYAPSSLRGVSPFGKVVAVEGNGRIARYSLRDKHWELAYTHLAYGTKIPVVPLAVFLYRDFALYTPSVQDLVSIFREEFGYLDSTSGVPNTEFNQLFTDDSAADSHAEWFEVIT